MISDEEIRQLRSELAIASVINVLGIERRQRGTRLTLRCPQCGKFHSAINEATNLARCFRCKRNYNPIDLVMAVRRAGFLDAIAWLRAMAEPTTRERMNPQGSASPTSALSLDSSPTSRRKARPSSAAQLPIREAVPLESDRPTAGSSE